ncbi:PaaI family thioesterase [Microbacterium sp. A93]|uniref:PaaI family thioesterase n=1 Tax=Microbacterium sp. A93 TaxID=3450716 RepID=UPI003F42AEB3
MSDSSTGSSPLPNGGSLHNATSNHTDVTPHEAKFAGVIATLRDALSAVSASRPPEEVLSAVELRLRDVIDLTASHQVGEHDRIAGRLWEITGRGQALVPPVHYEFAGGHRTRGWVSFSKFHIGNGAAHGGAIAMVFDEIMGRTLAVAGIRQARTANLSVNFRRLVPTDTKLLFEAELLEQDGRKLITSCELTDADGNVLSDARGLFILAREPIVY